MIWLISFSLMNVCCSVKWCFRQLLTCGNSSVYSAIHKKREWSKFGVEELACMETWPWPHWTWPGTIQTSLSIMSVGPHWWSCGWIGANVCSQDPKCCECRAETVIAIILRVSTYFWPLAQFYYICGIRTWFFFFFFFEYPSLIVFLKSVIVSAQWQDCMLSMNDHSSLHVENNL